MSSLLDRRPHSGVAELVAADRRDLLDLVDADPYVNAPVSARVRAATSFEPRSLGGTILGYRDPHGRLTAAVFCGGILVPIGAGPPEVWRAIADRVGGAPRGCGSIVGEAGAVRAVWSRLALRWGPPRDLRDDQPLLYLPDDVVLPPGDVRVRVVRPDDLDRYEQAASAMFSEELGIAPNATGRGSAYRARLAELIDDRRCVAIFDAAGDVIFKSDLSVVSPHTCQVQGVWLRRDQRGRGLAAPAFAAVLGHARARAPSPSLYVNAFNLPARRVYARLGMRQAATMASVLF